MSERQQTQQSKELKSNNLTQKTLSKQMLTSNPAAIIQRARIDPKSLTTADVLQLQRTIGNRPVGRLLSEIGLVPSKTKQAQTVQMQIMPEEEKESLQGKFAEPLQRQEIPEEEPLQTKMENNTGMPDNLKAGVENLSGIDMSDVRVHYNSSKTAEVGALAYTQGTDIHVAPSQERHLPHEAWHVVQQAQGRIRPTLQLKDMAVNDDVGLEKEADEMGKKAIEGRTNLDCSNKNRFLNVTVMQRYPYPVTPTPTDQMLVDYIIGCVEDGTIGYDWEHISQHFSGEVGKSQFVLPGYDTVKGYAPLVITDGNWRRDPIKTFRFIFNRSVQHVVGIRGSKYITAVVDIITYHNGTRIPTITTIYPHD